MTSTAASAARQRLEDTARATVWRLAGVLASVPVVPAPPTAASEAKGARGSARGRKRAASGEADTDADGEGAPTPSKRQRTSTETREGEPGEKSETGAGTTVARPLACAELTARVR